MWGKGESQQHDTMKQNMDEPGSLSCSSESCRYPCEQARVPGVMWRGGRSGRWRTQTFGLMSWTARAGRFVEENLTGSAELGDQGNLLRS